jgi:site-specific DNA-methyltransferase (adenine-specific)
VNEQIRRAFLDVCEGYSVDRVIADPAMNVRFLEACRNLGLRRPPVELNSSLLNARKSKSLGQLPRAKRTSFSEEEEYRFASEVAARFFEHRTGLTVDQVLCDPNTASEFDTIAETIAPGYAPLQYRWAALNLRKSKRLSPEILSHVAPAESIDLGPIEALDAAHLPLSQGIYIFYSPTATLYVGETSNIRKRIAKHLDHSDNKGLARWFWENGFSRVLLEIRVLPNDTTSRVRSALESELIRSRKPVFNVQCASR